MRKLYKFLLMGITVFFLTGCANTLASDKEQENSIPYKADFVVIENLTWEQIYNTYLTEDAFYYGKTNEDIWTIYRRVLHGMDTRMLENLGEEEVVLTLEQEENLLGYTVAITGDIFCVVKSYTLNNSNYTEAAYHEWKEPVCELRKYNVQGELLWIQKLSEDISMVQQLLVGTDKIYLCTGEEVYSYNIQGEQEKLIYDAENYIDGMALSEQEQLYVIENCHKGKQLIAYGEEHTKWENKVVLDTSYMLLRNNKKVFLTDGSKLLVYNENSNEIDYLLSLSELNVATELMKSMFIREDGSYWFVGVNNEEIELSLICPIMLEGMQVEEKADEKEEGDNTCTTIEMQPEQKIEKVEIEFATATSTGSTLLTEVANMNRRYSQYKYVLKEYTKSEDGQAQLNASLLTNDAPDIIEIGSGFYMGDYENYVKDGYLEDLTPYLKNSNIVTLEDILPQVLEDFSIDGKIYAIPSRFSINVLTVPLEVSENRSNWTIEEFLEFMEKYPHALSWQDASVEQVKKEILTTALRGSLDGFVDLEKGVSSFNNNRFQELLTRVQELDIHVIHESKEERSAKGEILLENLWITRNRDLAEAEYQYGVERELALMGFPSASDEQDNQLGAWICYSKPVGIFSQSSQKEGAWLFVQNRIAGALFYQERGIDYPTGKEAFAQKMSEEMEVAYEKDEGGNYVLDENGEKVESIKIIDGIPYKAITKEQVERINAVMKNTFTVSSYEQQVMNIICEEAALYFAGTKSLDEVVDIIQSRIQLSLDEQGIQ